MIIAFATEKTERDLLCEHAAMSEAWSREQVRQFWADQKAADTPMWRAFGGTLNPDSPGAA